MWWQNWRMQMYYIRKLSKLSTVSKIKNITSIDETPADLLKQELPTTGNTLSFWRCESLDDVKDTMKAILLAATSIEKSRFIIFDDSMLEFYDIQRDLSKEGKTGYLGYENLHVDFCDLTYRKIGCILNMIKEVLDNEQMNIELSKECVKSYIKEVCDAGLLNEEKTDEHLLADIKKYGLYSV